jgi:hypothetical protein
VYNELKPDTWRERYFPDIDVYRFWYISPFERDKDGKYSWILRLDVKIGREKLLYEWIKLINPENKIDRGDVHFINESRELSDGGSHTLISSIFKFKHNKRSTAVMVNK